MDNCYEKYLKTVKIVNEQIKKMGYEKYSIYAYKGYPEHQISTSYFYDINTLGNYPIAPFAMRFN